MKYVADSDVLICLGRIPDVAGVKFSSRPPVVITAAVWDEVVTHAKPNPALEAMLMRLAGTPVEFLAGTAEARAFAQLDAPGELGPGEVSVIAHAHVHGGVAVLLDRKALHAAVEELRGRVLSVHGFLRMLCEKHGLDPGIANQIAAKLRASQQHIQQPLWW